MKVSKGFKSCLSGGIYSACQLKSLPPPPNTQKKHQPCSFMPNKDEPFPAYKYFLSQFSEADPSFYIRPEKEKYLAFTMSLMHASDDAGRLNM